MITIVFQTLQDHFTKTDNQYWCKLNGVFEIAVVLHLHAS